MHKVSFGLVVLALTICAVGSLAGFADYVAGIEGPPYPVPVACAVSLEEPVSFADNPAEWMRYEGSLWTRLGDKIYLPEFYKPSEAPAGYLKAKMYWPDKWEIELELVVACEHFGESADVTGIIGEAMTLVAEGYNGLSVFEDEYGFDLAWLERSLEGAIEALHPPGQRGQPFQVEFIIIGYDIRWRDFHQEWHHYCHP